MAGVSLSFNKRQSLREYVIKIVVTDFHSCYEEKSNSSPPVSKNSVLMYYELVLRFLLFIFSLLINLWILSSRNSLVTSSKSIVFIMFINTVSVRSIALFTYL